MRTFTSLENEGDTFPSRVMNPQGGCSERRANRVVRYGIVIQIAGLAIRSNILAKQRVLPLNGGNGTEYFDLISHT